MDSRVVDENGSFYRYLLNKSFKAKIIQASKEVQEYYSVLKNEVLSYTKAKDRLSWNNDTINCGRNKILKFAIKGKTLCVYFALNPKKYLDTKYKVEVVEAKKYADYPCLYRIKNNRRKEYSKDLIKAIFDKLKVEQGDVPEVDYSLPYEDTDTLIRKGLIKKVKTKATVAQVKKAEAKGEILKVEKEEDLTFVDQQEIVEHHIQVKEPELDLSIEGSSTKVGKRGIINVDEINLYFKENDTVTLKKLKDFNLVDKNVSRVKLLARGSLEKKLNFELQDYSKNAIKQVLKLNGTVKRA